MIKITSSEKTNVPIEEKTNIPIERGEHIIKKQTITKWFFIIFVFVVIIMISLINTGSKSNSLVDTGQKQKEAEDRAKNERELNSIVFAEEVIKKILKAPSTAKFVDVKAYELSNEKDVWAINGYVDSQNSFGAMLRNQWEIQLDYRDGKGGTVKSILFDGEKML